MGIADAPEPILALADAGKALIGLERVAAGGDEIDDGVEIRARQPGIGRGLASPRRKARRSGTARRRRSRARAARARRARRRAAAACPARSRRWRRARRGIPAPRSGSPERARPSTARPCGDWRGRCAAGCREAPFGAPTLMTRSTSPQSTPRSSDDVHTTARRRPAAIAASTLRRCATSSEP